MLKRFTGINYFGVVILFTVPELIKPFGAKLK